MGVLEVEVRGRWELGGGGCEVRGAGFRVGCGKGWGVRDWVEGCEVRGGGG